MNEAEIKAFNTLSSFGLVPVPQPRDRGSVFHCHSLTNPMITRQTPVIAARNADTGRWGVIAPSPLQAQILKALNG